MKHSFKSLLSSLAAMLLVVPAFAQVTTSALNGLVTDQSGEPLAGAVVVAVHVPTGSQYYAVANNQGQYAIKGMRAGGPYEVNISFIGSQTVVVKDVTLQLGEPYSLNASLKDAAQQLQEVVLVASATSFSEDKTGPATNISVGQINSLPTVNRSITDIAKYSPYANGMSFAGGDGRSTNFTVDGANFNNNFGLSSDLPGGGTPISMDAIQEVQVVIAPFDVRQTNFVGGGMNAITKSGTNQFKGTAYTYHYNGKTHGVNAHGVKTTVPDMYEHHVYGGTVGGPIIKDKLFFFVSAERTVEPGSITTWRAWRDGDAVDDKGNPKADNQKQISRTKAEDLANVADALKQRYGYDTGSYTSFPAETTNTKILGRIDWNINADHKLAVRYNWTQNLEWKPTNSNSSDAYSRHSGSRLGSQYSHSYMNSCYNLQNNVSSISADLNSRLGDKMHNQLLVTYTNISDIRGTYSDEFPFIDILYADPAVSGSISPYISAGYELFTYNNGVYNKIITIKDDFSYDLGKHHFLAGASFEHQFANNAYMRNGTGYYRYRSLSDFYKANGYDPETHSLVDPDMSVAPETVNLTYGYNGATNPTAQVTFNQIGLYLQDEWDVTRNFKLTYGVRFDALVFDEKDIMRNQAMYDVDFGGRHVDTGKWPAAHITPSPRVGFNWDVFGDRSLKVRGGAGLFTGRLPLVFFTNMPTNSNMIQNKGVISTKWEGKVATPDAALASFAGPMIVNKSELLKKMNEVDPTHFPLDIKPEDGVLGTGAINGVDPNFKMPLVAKFSLGADYKVPVNFPLTVSAEGVFNKTVYGVRMTNYNMKDNSGWDRLPGADNRLIYPSDAKYGSTEAFVLTNTTEGYGYTTNVTINANPIPALRLMAAYTLTEQKEITGMPGSDASSAYTGLYTVNGPEFATLQRSQYVRPGRAIASASWTQKWRGLEGFDTHISLFYEGYSAGGYSFFYDNDLNRDGVANDLIYIPNKPTELQWASADDMIAFWKFVNQDKYLRSHKGQYAEAYSARSPWLHQFDLRIAQDVALKIGKTLHRLEFSADIMNIGNMLNQNWGIPHILECNNGKILKCTNVESLSSTVAPVYQFSGNSDHTFTHSGSFYNCWQLQFGVRYLFN